MEALTSSSSSRALFISSCNRGSSLNRLVGLPSEMAGGCLTWDVPPASNELGLVGQNGCWVDWAKLGELLGGVAWGEVCGRVTTWVGMVGSVPPDLREFPVPQLGKELPGPLMVAVSWKWCIARESVGQWGKTTVAALLISWDSGQVDLLLWWRWEHWVLHC